MKYVLEVLFPYIFLLYVFDCLTFVNARHVLLTSMFGGKFDVKRPGVRLAGLFPISQAITSPDLPIVYTGDGIHAVFEESQRNSGIDRAEDFTFINYEDLQPVKVEGKNIKFTSTCTIKTPSSLCARFQAEFINDLKKSGPAARQEKIKAFLADAHDPAALDRIATSHSKSFFIIKMLSAYLFVLVFFILPAALFTDLTRFINFNALVICIFSIYLLLLLVSYLTLKKLYPSENGFRLHTLLSIIFAPVNACHVLGYLTKDLFFKFDHLAITACFLPRKSFQEFARKELVLIDLLKNEMVGQGWLKFWAMKKKLLLGLLEDREISLKELLAPPQKQDHTAIYFCPFCMTEYRHKRHRCIDCEIALREFSEKSIAIPLDPSPVK